MDDMEQTQQQDLNAPKPAIVDAEFEAYKKAKQAELEKVEKARQEEANKPAAEKPEITALRTALTDAIHHDNPHTRSHKIWLALAATLPAEPKKATATATKK
jgi:hypothetical protein